MKRIAVLCILALCLSGCSGIAFRDIDKRFFVVALGIDKADQRKGYTVSLKLGIPTGKIEAGQELFEVIHQEAETITEAIRLLKSKVDKELDYGHTKIFVLGKSLVQEDITETMEWLVRRRDIQFISYLAIGEPDAMSVMKMSPGWERLPGNTLFLTFSTEGVETSYILTEYLFDMNRRIHEKGKDPYLPIIKLKGNTFEINQVALLDKRKARLITDPEETELLDLFRKEGFHRLALKTKSDGNVITLGVTDVKCRYSIVKDPEGGQAIDVRMKLKGIVEESTQSIISKDLLRYRKSFEDTFNRKLSRFLRKVVSQGIDPIGFGLRYRASRMVSAEEWERWTKTYPAMPVRVHTDVVIEGTGVTK